LVTNGDRQCRQRHVGGSICLVDSLDAIQLIALLLVVAIVAAIAGFVGSAIARRRRQRARRFFVLGFSCGLLTGRMLRRRRRRVVSIAPCTIRLRRLATAGAEMFHDATSSGTFLRRRFY
jgi:hypothetical protein